MNEEKEGKREEKTREKSLTQNIYTNCTVVCITFKFVVRNLHVRLLKRGWKSKKTSSISTGKVR